MGENVQNGFEVSGTTTNRPDNVEEGQYYFNETLAQMQIHDGSNWLTVITTTSAGVVPAATITTLTTGAIVGADSSLGITGKAPSPAATGNSGAVVLSTPDGGSTSGESGGAQIFTGVTTDGATGRIDIFTGDAAGSSKDSGNINIDTGTSGDGNAGDINIAASNAKVGFFGTSATAQASAIGNASGTDATIIDSIRDALKAIGITD